MSDLPFSHQPVLLAETLYYLNVRPGGRYVDGTVGGGGHARAIIERAQPGGRLLGLDVDPVAVAAAREALREYGGQATIVRENFSRLAEVVRQHDLAPVDGVLLDLGVSSYQLADRTRGFSFSAGGPLDMRMSGEGGTTAADLVNTSSERDLADALFRYGDEPQSRWIARAIVQARPILTAEQLAKVVTDTVGSRRHQRIHPATRTFQALRIAVNHELEALPAALEQAIEVLRPGGRLVVITFHSLEDRIVKSFMKQEARGCICPPRVPQCQCGRQPRLTECARRVLVPSADEIQRNPRARSAKLRAAEKLELPER